MNEKLLEKKLCRWAKKLGGEAYKWWPVSVTGIPDRIVLLPGGRIGFAELKSTGEDLRPRQRVVIKFLLKLGFLVGIVDDLHSLQKFQIAMVSIDPVVIEQHRIRTKFLLETKYAPKPINRTAA